MSDLERALIDLAEHLDEPAGADMAARVIARIRLGEVGDVPEMSDVPDVPDVPKAVGEINQIGDHESPDHRRLWLLAAAAVVVLLLGLVAVPPTRDAIAGWLGIGAIEIRPAPQSPGDPTPGSTPDGSTPIAGAPSSDNPASNVVSPAVLSDAKRQLGFELRLPTEATAGLPSAISVDTQPPGGLAAITYKTFTLVEIASSGTDRPPIAKTMGPDTKLEATSVNGHDGYWITGAPHEIGYLDRRGQFNLDTVRRAGNVLIWSAGEVTYRIEGPLERREAERIATSIPS